MAGSTLFARRLRAAVLFFVYYSRAVYSRSLCDLSGILGRKFSIPLPCRSQKSRYIIKYLKSIEFIHILCAITLLNSKKWYDVSFYDTLLPPFHLIQIWISKALRVFQLAFHCSERSQQKSANHPFSDIYLLGAALSSTQLYTGRMKKEAKYSEQKFQLEAIPHHHHCQNMRWEYFSHHESKNSGWNKSFDLFLFCHWSSFSFQMFCLFRLHFAHVFGKESDNNFPIDLCT